VHRLVVQDVPGNLDEDRSPPAGHGGAQRRSQQLGNAFGLVNLDRELGHGPEHPEQVEFLERVLLVVLERDTADEDDDRRMGHVCCGDPGEQVRRPGSARDQAHARRVRHTAEPVRHEGGGLFVAHVDVLDARVVVERVEDIEKGRAHDPEDVPDLLGLQQLDDRPSRRDFTHVATLPVRLSVAS
jgi:hypothetical protein